MPDFLPPCPQHVAVNGRDAEVCKRMRGRKFFFRGASATAPGSARLSPVVGRDRHALRPLTGEDISLYRLGVPKRELVGSARLQPFCRGPCPYTGPRTCSGTTALMAAVRRRGGRSWKFLWGTLYVTSPHDQGPAIPTAPPLPPATPSCSGSSAPRRPSQKSGHFSCLLPPLQHNARHAVQTAPRRRWRRRRRLRIGPTAAPETLICDRSNTATRGHPQAADVDASPVAHPEVRPQVMDS
jgi:hypothetical protein